MNCETCGSELVPLQSWLLACPCCCPIWNQHPSQDHATDEPPREKDAMDEWKKSLPVAECIGRQGRKRKFKINGERYLCVDYSWPLKPGDTLNLGEVAACIHETATRGNAVKGEKPQHYKVLKARRFVRIDEPSK